MDQTTTHRQARHVKKNINGYEEERLSPSLTQQLINRFSEAGVSYCHWKSNIDLAKSLEGELDIDLLVSIHSLAHVTKILMELGFKPAISRWASNPPGIFHYYGYDSAQKSLVHLHMFTRVLTGESFLKSHLLPFEEMLLDNTISINGMAVTSKEAELVLFVLRTCIKYGSFLDVARLQKNAEKVRQEAQWLKDGSDMQRVAFLLEKYCQVVDWETFDACLNTILNGDPLPQKWILSRRIRRRLRIYRKYSSMAWLANHIKFLAITAIKKLRKQRGSKIFTSGGTIIAIVGADATGKSTMVSETSRWLRKNFVVNTIHAGKPPSTLLTAPVNFLLAVYRGLKRKLRPAKKWEKEIPSRQDVDDQGDGNSKSLVYAIRAVCLAWDRRALLLKARHACANGELIVCDRYPTNATGMMDSPRLLENPAKKGPVASIYNRLAHIERGLYRQIPPPDIVLRLHVSLETAKKRNAARENIDDETYLQNRHRQARDWSVNGTRSIHDIDTDLPLDETLQAVKQAIWSSL